jgi:HD-GYP domain-containing protein (c-di-GMP phosphodiesterase class II)
MSGPPAVKLSELVATLSLVSDLGMGRPVERVLRQTVIAMRLADLADAGEEVRAATYYTSLLTWVGCAADTSDLAGMFGDETQLFADSHDGDLAGVNLAAFMLRHLGRGSTPIRRLATTGAFVATAGGSVRQIMQSHCQSTGELADRLGLGDGVRQPLVQAFERWDGRGIPGTARADGLDIAARIVHLADCIEWFHFTAGAPRALHVVRQRRGTQFDPDLVDLFCRHAATVLAGVGEISAWEEVIALDPRLGEELDDGGLDNALEALGDFADLKSPSRTGHSRGVAVIAERAAGDLGLDPLDVQMVRRAALVHDVGMIGVPSAVWEATRPWTVSQRELARTHPYLLERMLARTPLLSRLAHCASLHHERLDGSGYPRGVRADAIPVTARIVAAADVHHALTQARPHRAAVDAATAQRILLDEVRAGRLDGEVVNAILRADGQRVRRRPELPGGLTRREAEVLVSLARGRSNAEIAEDLSISRKTVSSHLERIFTKLGVSTRTEAALFAMRHSLFDVTTPT